MRSQAAGALSRPIRVAGDSMHVEDLIERWWTPTGRALAYEAFRFLRGERPIPQEIDFHEDRADLRGIGVPPVPAAPPLPRLALNAVHWRDLDLSHAWLRGLRGTGIIVENCVLDRATCRHWRLEGSRIVETSSDGADFQGATLSAGYDGTAWTGVGFDEADLRGLTIVNGRFLGCSFAGTHLDRTRWVSTVLDSCTFAGPLRHVTFDGTGDCEPRTRLDAVDFTDAVFIGARFANVRIRSSQMPPGVTAVPDYPAALADAMRRLEGDQSSEAGMLRALLAREQGVSTDPESVGVIDRVALVASGGEALANLAEEHLLGSTRERRAKRVEMGPATSSGNPVGVAAGLMDEHNWTPAGLDSTEIDLVAQSPEGEVTLLMVETRPWGSIPDHGDRLADKITAYAQYRLTGALARDYPRLADLPIQIRLECATDPTPEIDAVLSLAGRSLTETGAGRLVVFVDEALRGDGDTG